MYIIIIFGIRKV